MDLVRVLNAIVDAGPYLLVAVVASGATLLLVEVVQGGVRTSLWVTWAVATAGSALLWFILFWASIFIAFSQP